jgi:uncharacterized membrane protein YgcG
MSRRLASSLLAPIVAVLGLVTLLALPALAQQIPRLTGQVTDDAGLLTGREDEVRDALTAARDQVQLFVYTTDTTGSATVTDHAEQVAASNSLGGNDALLLVAIEDRSYALWAADDLASVSDAELAEISRDVVEPQLAAGAFAEATIEAAEALAAATQTPNGDSTADDGAAIEPSESDGRRLSGWFLPLMLLLPVVGFGALGAVAAVRERRGRRRTAEERDRQIGELARRTNARLIASDEAVREAATELGFAEAQFHPDDVAPFARGLADARQELHAAFAQRQRLDDDLPDTLEERQALLEQIDAHTQRIDELLTAEHARLDELRDLERRAPELLGALVAQIASLTSRREENDAAHARVVAASPSAREAIDGNLVEADKHLRGASAAVTGGLQAADDGQPSVAGRALREAELSLAAADRLITAVERAADALDEAERGIGAAISSAEAALDRAGEALSGAPEPRDAVTHTGPPAPPPGAAGAADPPPPPPMPGPPDKLLVEGRGQLTQARVQRVEDVIRAYELATGAEAAADEVLGRVKEAHDRRDRAVASARTRVQAAQVAYDRAGDFIETRRRGIGRGARTRLQEAERHLTTARRSIEQDPTEAVQQAKTAERLAAEAYDLAKQDFHDYDDMRGPFGRGPYGGRGGGTVVIGGFPIPLGGTRRRGGGFGGSVWGSPGSTRGTTIGGGFGGGRSAGGGFGSAGRSMGGGFGGGRSRGGRF